MPPSARLHRQRGAALLLLLVVAGLAVSSLLITSYRADNDASRQRRSALQVAEAKEALLGYALAHGRLPRPATSAEDGREMPSPCIQDSCSGILPWVTLGVNGTDAWGKLLRYSVSPDFARRILPGDAVADRRILRRDSAGEIYFLIGSDRCDRNSRCAPAVVFSSGKNNLGISTLGMPLANGAVNNQDEQQNDSDTRDFFARRLEHRTQVPGGEFDDIVAWVPLQTLFRRIEASGAPDSN